MRRKDFVNLNDYRIITNEMLGSYKIRRLCLNCWATTYSIHEYGTKATDLAVCSSCGCNSAIRSNVNAENE